MPTTLDQIRTKCRTRADMRNTSFLTDSEINSMIQDSYGELYDLIIESAGIDHFVTKSDTITTAAGQESYSINELNGPPAVPAQVYKTIAVDVKINGDFRPIRPGTWADRNLPTDPWLDHQTVRYLVTGPPLSHKASGSPALYERRLTLFPVAQGAHEVRVYYVPIPPDLVSTTQQFQDYPGWDEYVVVDVAAKMLETEESETGHLHARKAAIAERIRWHAQTMNHDGPARVRNVDVEQLEPLWWRL